MEAGGGVEMAGKSRNRKGGFPPGRGLIGVVHLKPLPGSPRGGGSFEAVYKAALQDGMALAAGGMDALIVENFGDAPFFPERVEPHTVGVLAVAAHMLKEATGLPVGVNCLRNDGLGAMGAAAAAGGAFVRINVLTGAAVTDQGIVQGCAPQVLRYRKHLGSRIRVVADVLVKHAVPLGETDPVRLARDTVSRGLADALVVTGPETGTAVDPEVLAAVKKALPRVPLLVGSGVTAESAPALLERADGLIVGTWLKKEGRLENPVDPERVRLLVKSLSPS